MSGPRFIGIRDVVDPYKGLQDSVSKVGDIYRQYNKDIQEADRIRNEEARQSEQLAMQRTAHEIAVGEHAEKERIRGVTRDFDPEKQIKNYGIPEKFIPEIDKAEQKVRDYYSRAPLIAAGNGAEGTQARQQVEKSFESFPALRTEALAKAFDSTTAQRQGLAYLTSQGVPVPDAVAMVQARTLGKDSHAEMYTSLQAQVKAADDRAWEQAKLQKDILVAQIRNNKPGTTGGTGSNTGTSSGVTGVTPAAIKKTRTDLAEVIGDGIGWINGDASAVVDNVNASVREINTKRQAHNEQVALGKIDAPRMPLVSFEEGINWLTETAEVDGNVEFKTPGSVKTFLEDQAAKRDFNTAVKLAGKGKGGAGGLLTGDDIKSIIPQGIQIPSMDEAVLSRITASYAKLFPEVFPKPTSATTPIARPSNTTADGGAGTGTNSERGDRGITPPLTDGQLNITGGTLPVRDGSGTSKGSEQQAIPREVVVPYNESPTPEQKNINAVVSRMAEIQERMLDPNLSGDERRELFRESQITGDSIRRMPDGDRILETIVTNARQARMQNFQDRTKAGKEHSSRERIIKEVIQINERLAGNLSPEVRRINEEQLKSLEKDFPSLGDPSSVGKQEFDNYISKLESQVRHRSAPGRGWGSSITLPKPQKELNEAKRLAGYQKTDGDRVQTLAQLQEADVQKIDAKRATVESNISKIEQELQSLRPNIRMQDPASIQQGFKLGKELRDATQELFRLNMSAPKPNSNSRDIPIPEGNDVGKGTSLTSVEQAQNLDTGLGNIPASANKATDEVTKLRNIPAPIDRGDYGLEDFSLSGLLKNRSLLQSSTDNTRIDLPDGTANSKPPTSRLDALNASTEGDVVAVASPVDSSVEVFLKPIGFTSDQRAVYDTNNGDPIKAVADGQVTSLSRVLDEGMTIVVTHNDGTQTTYTDWSPHPDVSENEWVKAGQVLMPASGIGEKTRFTVSDKQGKLLNPLDWLKNNAASNGESLESKTDLNRRNIPAPAKPTNTEKKALGGSTDSDPDGLNTLTEDKTVLPSPVDSKIPILKTPKGMTENQGLVYDTKEGDAINTVKAGQVIAVEHMRGAGTTVVVKHNDGTLTTYSDWSDNSYVNKGDWVKAGQLLMYASGVRQKTRFNVYGKNRTGSYASDWLKENAPKK